LWLTEAIKEHGRFRFKERQECVVKFQPSPVSRNDSAVQRIPLTPALSRRERKNVVAGDNVKMRPLRSLGLILHFDY
jgi:hypothetical protein